MTVIRRRKEGDWASQRLSASQQACAPGAGFRYVLRGALAVGIVLVAFVCSAQLVFSERSLDSSMKVVGRNSALMRTALDGRDFETAKTRVARMRDTLFPTIIFWRNHQETEAVTLLKQVVTALDDLDVALSHTPVDSAAAAAAASKVDSACQRCHAVYRQQDPASKTFSVKERQ